MKLKWWFFILLGILVLTVTGYLLSPLWNGEEMYESSPLERESNFVILSEVLFQASAHDVSGKVVIIDSSKGKILRFEDFETINGPDLRIYLAADLEAKDFIDLGEIKAIKGDVNYNIPQGTDLTKYKYVLVWCRAFSILFSYAELPVEEI